MHLRFQLADRSGNLVLRTYDLQVGYEDEGRPLFSVPDLVLERRECVAVIGPNGAGKTTLLKTVLNQIPPYSGRVELGANLKVGYFAQAHEGLVPENTLMDEIGTVAPSMLPAEVRNYLARYGFQGDEVFAQVATLSGGERGRLALAKLALSDANLLMLDEPTNHLDLATQEVLQDVLAQYPGTIMLVSHDRYLIDALATQIWELDTHSASLQVFKGAYSEFRQYKEGRLLPGDLEEVPLASEPMDEPVTTPVKAGLSRNQRQQIEKKLAALEQKIHAAEMEKGSYEAYLSKPSADLRKLEKVTENYQAVSIMLEKLLAEWESLAQQLHQDD
jgi:ATP-binding cassette subfamily F protein 3